MKREYSYQHVWDYLKLLDEHIKNKRIPYMCILWEKNPVIGVSFLISVNVS